MTVTVVRETRPIARKAHGCGYCLGRIEPGTRYVRQANAQDGKLYTFAAHEECQIIAWEMDPDDGAPDPSELRHEVEVWKAAAVMEARIEDARGQVGAA